MCISLESLTFLILICYINKTWVDISKHFQILAAVIRLSCYISRYFMKSITKSIGTLKSKDFSSRQPRHSSQSWRHFKNLDIWIFEIVNESYLFVKTTYLEIIGSHIPIFMTVHLLWSLFWWSVFFCGSSSEGLVFPGVTWKGRGLFFFSATVSGFQV